MSDESLIIRKYGKVLASQSGKVLTPPEDWAFLPPGDGPLTLKVKKAGPSWAIQEKKGRKVFSKGLWAPADNINRCKKELESRRTEPDFLKKKASGEKRKLAKHLEYTEEFFQKTCEYLNFLSCHKDLEKDVARAVTDHSVPVGSGTVARTNRITVEKRVEAAVIAWMRHKTTNYERMSIARVKGERRRVRRGLAESSVQLLKWYRTKDEIPESCLLNRALKEGGR